MVVSGYLKLHHMTMEITSELRSERYGEIPSRSEKLLRITLGMRNDDESADGIESIGLSRSSKADWEFFSKSRITR